MISKKTLAMNITGSAIRAMFEDGAKLAKIHGAENIYDFSLGNPSLPAPPAIKKAIEQILETEDSVMVHGYMTNPGYIDVREKIAQNLNKRFDTAFTSKNIIMSVGSAGAMNAVFKTLLNPGEEVITFAPYFGEYLGYVENHGGTLTVMSPDTETFQPNLEEFSKRLSANTKAVIINSPNNPSGVVYSPETIKRLAEIMTQGQTKFGTSIYLVSDEPYRELVYDGVEVPFLTKYYANTIVCYSFSKSLSLPGERIGYLTLPDEVDDFDDIFACLVTSTRSLGFINAPSLMQRAVAMCLDERADLEAYNKNRERLYGALTKIGYTCVKPQGAFYMIVKSPIPDEKEFCEYAKKYRLLIVPCSAFGCPGYVRLAYCVSPEVIEGSLPSFEKLAADYNL